MAGYIPELVQYLKDGFDVSDLTVFRYHLDKLSLDASFAIPVALIINKALTNSIKYSFQGKETRRDIDFFILQDNGLIKLELTDIGVGMNET